MNVLKPSLLVFLGAGLGAVCRYWITLGVHERTAGTFPWGTLIVNLSGCLLIGIILGLAGRSGLPADVQLTLVVGLLGGFTTFSSFAADIVRLGGAGSLLPTLTYLSLSNGLGILLCWAGLRIFSFGQR